MNELPTSIQTLANASAAFAMLCVALYVVFKLWIKAEAEKTKLLIERGDSKQVLESLERKIDEANNKLNTLMLKK